MYRDNQYDILSFMKNIFKMDHIHEEHEEAGKIFLHQKEVYVIGEINPNSTGNFLAAFKEADSRPGKITVNICSSGGWVEGGMAMHDAIKMSRNPVVTVNCGAVYSSAVLPFQAGDLRLMFPSSRLFFHDMSLGIGDATLKTVKSVVSETNRLYKLYCDYVALRVGCSPKFIDSLCQKESYLSATQCISLRLTDDMLIFNNNKKFKSKKKVK